MVRDDLQFGLYCSTREEEYIRTTAFWKNLKKALESGKLRTVGVSVVTPYGITYKSSEFRQFVTTDLSQFFALRFVELIEKIPSQEIEFVIWISTLFNTYIEGEHQKDAYDVASDYLCPNDRRNLNFVKRVVQEIPRKDWLKGLRSHGNIKLGVFFDRVRFLDEAYCFCKYCRKNFVTIFSELGFKNAENAWKQLRQNLTRSPKYYYFWSLSRQRSLQNFLRSLAETLGDLKGENKPYDQFRTRFEEFGGEKLHAEGTTLLNGQSFEDILQLDDFDKIDVQISPSTDLKELREWARLLGFSHLLSYLSGKAAMKHKTISILIEEKCERKDFEASRHLTYNSGVDKVIFMPFEPKTLQNLSKWIAEL